jgi:hypothetical protein
VPPAPVAAKPASDQLTPDHPAPRPVDVETLLAAAPSARDTVASSAPAATPVPVPIARAGDEERGWMATWLGVLLMVLGLFSFLGSIATIRGHRGGQTISPSEDELAANRQAWDEADQRFENFRVRIS